MRLAFILPPMAFLHLGSASTMQQNASNNRARRHCRIGLRGFTLLEILTVIIIISLLAAIAAPAFSRMIHDRGVSRATLQAMDIYRIARARALERDVVMVRWNAAGGPNGVPRIEFFEPVVTAIGALPPTCQGTAWGPGSPANRSIGALNFSPIPANNPNPDEAGASELSPPIFRDSAGAVQSFADICFTARGKSFIRLSDGDPFVPLTGINTIEMKNKRTNVIRTVFIAPNSPARVAL